MTGDVVLFDEQWLPSGAARLFLRTARPPGPTRAEVAVTHGLGEHSGRHAHPPAAAPPPAPPLAPPRASPPPRRSRAHASPRLRAPLPRRATAGPARPRAGSRIHPPRPPPPRQRRRRHELRRHARILRAR